MLTILKIMLGIVFGFLALLFILIVMVRLILNKYGYSGYSFSKLFQAIKDAREENMIKHKQVNGMTNIYLPTILKDFPDFNEKEFYTKTEEYIRHILNNIESENLKAFNNSDYDLIRGKLVNQIRDLIDNNVKYRYDDIIFHKHAIKSYHKTKNVVKLDISTSLEYYYEKIQNGKTVISNKRKKQTRYTVSYVYIYDTNKAGFDIQVLGINCPNCGSPISSFEKKTCSYCKSGLNITVANLQKCWKIVDLKEDY